MPAQMPEGESGGAAKRNLYGLEGGWHEPAGPDGVGGADGADITRTYASLHVFACGRPEHGSPHAHAVRGEQRLASGEILQPSSVGGDRGDGSMPPGYPSALCRDVLGTGYAIPGNAIPPGPNAANYWPDPSSCLDSSSSSRTGMPSSLWSSSAAVDTRAFVDLSAHSAAELSVGSSSGDYALDPRTSTASGNSDWAMGPARWSLPFPHEYVMPSEFDEASCATTCPASTQRDDEGMPPRHNIEALLDGVRRMQLAQQGAAHFSMSPPKTRALPDARSQQILWEQAMQQAAQQAISPSIGPPVQHLFEPIHAQTSQQALQRALQHAQLQNHMQAQAMAQLQAQLQPLPPHGQDCLSQQLQMLGQTQLAQVWLQAAHAQLQQTGATRSLDQAHAMAASGGYPSPFCGSNGTLRATVDSEQASATALERLRHVAEFGDPLSAMGHARLGDADGQRLLAERALERSIESGSLSSQSSSSTSSQGGNSQLSRRHRRSQRGGEDRRNLNNATFDICKVIQNEDRRATVMIRNIPNMFSQKTLLCLMEPNHAGKFDLLYLPIDFKNKCNVGYAFINFTSYYHLPAFYEEFNGRKWSRFNSNKVAQINYARIQGKDALIAHFANSSLIHEDESMQPLIFASDGSGAREAWRHHESRPRHRRPRA